ncbi:MAG: DUF4410 domain-containing protein [Candidatus Binatia bacterium]
MNRFTLVAVSLLALVAAGGCSSTNVSARRSEIGNEKLPRPNNIIVYNFAATPDEIAAHSPEAAQHGEPAAQSRAEMETGRKLGAAVARELVKKIDDMGLAASGAAGVVPRPGDIVIKGYFDTVNEGSAGKRIMLGFGSGAANLRTVVVAYQMTPSGLRRLGAGEVDSSGSKTPGMLVPLAVVAATANPIGLAVGGAIKVAGEATGADTIEGVGRRTAKEIAVQLETAFKRQGWIR